MKQSSRMRSEQECSHCSQLANMSNCRTWPARRMRPNSMPRQHRKCFEQFLSYFSFGSTSTNKRAFCNFQLYSILLTLLKSNGIFIEFRYKHSTMLRNIFLHSFLLNRKFRFPRNHKSIALLRLSSIRIAWIIVRANTAKKALVSKKLYR